MWVRGVLPTALPALFSATLSLALSVYPCGNVGSQGLLVVGLPALFVPHSTSLWVLLWQRKSSLPWLPVCAPPTGLDECFFFISLVVRLLCHSIFRQFLLCEELQCVYLRLHLGSPHTLLFKDDSQNPL